MPLSDQQYVAMLDKASKHNDEMSAMEKENGFAAPQRCGLHTHLRTVEQALECAVKMKDWAIACEGIMLLRDAIQRVEPDKIS
jgi:hypothetical protein